MLFIALTNTFTFAFAFFLFFTIIGLVFAKIILFNDFAFFDNVEIIIYMLMNDVVFIYNIVLMFNNMLMFSDLLVFLAFKFLSVNRFAFAFAFAFAPFGNRFKAAAELAELAELFAVAFGA